MRPSRLAAFGLPLLALGLTAWASEPAPHAPPPWCMPTQDMQAQFLFVQTRYVATSVDETAAELRDSLAAMPMVPASEVELLSDEVLCQRASAALDSFYFDTPQAKAVYLARAGQRYAIHPPVDQPDDIYLIIHVDSAFNKTGVVVH